jgi:hypothetical protein
MQHRCLRDTSAESAFLTASDDTFNQWGWRCNRNGSNGFCDFCCGGTGTLPLEAQRLRGKVPGKAEDEVLESGKKTPINPTKLTKLEEKTKSSIFATGIGPTIRSDIRWREFETLAIVFLFSWANLLLSSAAGSADLNLLGGRRKGRSTLQ